MKRNKVQQKVIRAVTLSTIRRRKPLEFSDRGSTFLVFILHCRRVQKMLEWIIDEN